MRWNYQFYQNRYENSKTFLEFILAEDARNREKEDIRKVLQTQFTAQFINVLLNNKTQRRLNTASEYENGVLIQETSDSLYNTRTARIIERDTYGYITNVDYYRCSALGLKSAITVIHKDAKHQIIGTFINITKEKINIEGNSYSGTLSDNYYQFLRNYFNNRSEIQIVNDDSILLNLATALEWQTEVIALVRNEYPNIFDPNDDLDLQDETDYVDDIEPFEIDPKYRKYGGYNGFDDDTIDDAFEGDPRNTWNVD